MSNPSQRDHLARIRENQRRSRARRREYLQELEQRLRTCELQGIEASTEVQMAARRVADENRQLRELLNRNGVSDDQIAHYLQSGTVAPPEVGPGQRPFGAGDPGAAVQSLQQLMLPRQAASLDQGVSFPMASHSGQEAPPASEPRASSSVWGSTQPAMPSYGHPHPHQHSVDVAPAMGASGLPPYQATSFPGTAAVAQQHPLFGQTPPSLLSDPRRLATTQAMPMDRAAVSYHYSMQPYDKDATDPDYGPPGGDC